METQEKDVESFLKNFPAKTAPLQNQVNQNIINKQQKEINEMKGQIIARDEKIDNQDQTINRLEDKIVARDEKIDNQEKEIKEVRKLLHFLMQTNNTNVSDNFICPLTLELYQDPVITRCGHTFEHLPLIEWLSKHPNCPTCREDVNRNDLSLNRILKDAIQGLGNKPKKQMNNFSLIEIKEEKKDAQQE